MSTAVIFDRLSVISLWYVSEWSATFAVVSKELLTLKTYIFESLYDKRWKLNSYLITQVSDYFKMYEGLFETNLSDLKYYKL